MNPKLKKLLIALAILIVLVMLWRYFRNRNRCTCGEEMAAVSSGGGGGAFTQNAISKIIDPVTPIPRTGVVKIINSGGGGINYLGDEGGEIVSGSGFGVSNTHTVNE
jgi:hypothetical protein